MEVLAAVVLAVKAAVGVYGASVLTRAEDTAAEATVSLGQGLIQKIFRRAKHSGRIQDAVEDLAASPQDGDALAALRLQLKKALEDDPELAAEAAGMVHDAGMAVASNGDRANIAQTVAGIQSSGDQAIITQHSR